KGIRSSPRDALLGAVTPADQRGAAYGFHRAMDHTGAVIGPLLGYGLVAGLGVSLRHVFALAALPAALAMVALLGGVRDPAPTPRVAPLATPPAPPTRAAIGDLAALRRYL